MKQASDTCVQSSQDTHWFLSMDILTCFQIILRNDTVDQSCFSQQLPINNQIHNAPGLSENGF